MKRIGRYEVVRELRAGGMGTVTLGKSPDGQLVVLKRPHSIDVDAGVRLRDEARIGARLLHPSIVDTLDLFEIERGVPVLVVAYVDGPSLEVLRPLGPLPPVVIARIGRQIAEGLSALHEASDENGTPLHILHRDVTPGNIVIGKDGDAKLIDLGIARFSERQAEHTQDGFLRGTMRYLAPELLQGDTYSAASDLWSLGMVLWEAAIGRFAYRGETDREVLAGILRGEPMELVDDETVDAALAEVIRPLLQLSPLLRVASGEEAAARFAALEEHYADLDPAEETRAAIASALARKVERDAKQKAKLAEMLRPENLGFTSPMRPQVIGDDAFFADVATAAEVERYDDGALYDLPHTEPLHHDDDRASAALSHSTSARVPGPAAMRGDVDDDPTVPLKSLRAAIPLKVAEDDHEETTVNVPAPISFLTPPSLAEDGGEPEEDALDATVPMPTFPLARAAASSADEERHPRLTIDGEDTASVSDPRVPREALRSDVPDLPERAAEFDAGDLEPSAPPTVAPVATAGPAPELDDDELEQMKTMGGLSPVKMSAARAPEPQVVRSEDDPQALGRVALVRKTAKQVESEREKQSAPRSIDDLPPARPKPRADAGDDTVVDVAPRPPPIVPRQELADDDKTTVSPFSSLSEPDRDAEKIPAALARDLAQKDAAPAKRKRRKRSKGKRSESGPAKEALADIIARAGMTAAAADEDRGQAADEEEPSSLETRFVDEVALRERLQEQTQVSPSRAENYLPSSALGARLVELPPPQPPILPSPSLASANVEATVPIDALPAATPSDIIDDEAATERPPQRERSAGEVMKLNDVLAFLDDD